MHIATKSLISVTILDHLRYILRSLPSISVLNETLLCLLNMTNALSSVCTLLVRNDFVPFLLIYSLNEDSNVVLTSLRILGNITSCSIEYCTYLLQLGYLESLFSFASKNTQPLIIFDEFCWVLSNLSASPLTPAYANAICDVCLSLLKYPNTSIACSSQAALALCLLSLQPMECTSLISLPSLSALFDLLQFASSFFIISPSPLTF